MDDPAREPLLARRVPRAEIVPGRAYVVHARNGGIGVAVLTGGNLGFQLRREKAGRTFLFVEWDWSEGPPFGTAIPLRAIESDPPVEDEARLAWLAEREEEFREETEAAWDEVLGPSAKAWRRWREERTREREERRRGR